MNQQQSMFEPSESQGQQAHDENIQAQPYYWSTSPQPGKNSGAMPKNEHPATFETTIPPHSYAAQQEAPASAEYEAKSAAREREAPRAESRRQNARPGGTEQQRAYGYGMYGPYMQQVPVWAQPQRNNRSIFRWLLLIGLAILFLKPLVFILGHLLIGAGILFGVAALIILLPLLILLGILGVFGVVALITLSALGISLRPWRGRARWNSSRSRWRGRSWPNGPFWW